MCMVQGGRLGDGVMISVNGAALVLGYDYFLSRYVVNHSTYVCMYIRQAN
jgi:hypothetical protein